MYCQAASGDLDIAERLCFQAERAPVSDQTVEETVGLGSMARVIFRVGRGDRSAPPRVGLAALHLAANPQLRGRSSGWCLDFGTRCVEQPHQHQQTRSKEP